MYKLGLLGFINVAEKYIFWDYITFKTVHIELDMEMMNTLFTLITNCQLKLYGYRITTDILSLIATIMWKNTDTLLSNMAPNGTV